MLWDYSMSYAEDLGHDEIEHWNEIESLSAWKTYLAYIIYFLTNSISDQ